MKNDTIFLEVKWSGVLLEFQKSRDSLDIYLHT